MIITPSQKLQKKSLQEQIPCAGMPVCFFRRSNCNFTCTYSSSHYSEHYRQVLGGHVTFITYNMNQSSE